MKGIQKIYSLFIAFILLLGFSACGGSSTPEAALSTDATLSALTLSAGDIDPAFASGTTSYTLTTSSDATTITPSANDANTTVTINGTAVASGAASASIPLAVGDTAVSIVVTAEDGTSTTTYTVTVTREPAVSNNADLSSLSLSTGSLTPAFASATLAYTASVGFANTAINVTPTLSDANASVTVNGALVSSGAASTAINLDEGENTITLVVLAEDSTTIQTYTVVVTRQAASEFAQQAYIKASNPGSDDRLGSSMALDGDTLAVGAFFEDSNAIGIGGDETDNSATDSGAVYVFTRSAGSWIQQAYIKASNTDVFDNFGISVALDGDTLAVGASDESSNATGVDGDQGDNSAGESGAVYVFTRSAGSWTQQAYIKASNTEAADRFGTSVALDGDTLAVGAVFEASDSGAVYVFTRSAGNWTQQAYVKASNTNTDSEDSFGISVALDGDTLAVGASDESSNATGIGGDETDNSADGAGAVYVFTRSAGTWTQQAYIKASNTDVFDFFGFSVALNGDTLAVGASDESSNATSIGGDESNNDAGDSGAVYVFTRSGSTWTQQAYIKASNTDAFDEFGSSVALDGDTLAVGAIHEGSNATGVDGDQGDNNASEPGAVYVFTRSGSTWTQQAYIKASNTGNSDVFGTSVALDGDTLAVGATGESSSASGIDGDQGDNSAIRAGAVYVFDIPIP